MFLETSGAKPRKFFGCEKCVYGSGKHTCKPEQENIPWVGEKGNCVLDKRVPKNEVWFVEYGLIPKIIARIVNVGTGKKELPVHLL